MTKEDILQWLKNRGQTREWLAKECDVSKGTVDQWFSKGFPGWAIKAIQRLDGLPADPGAGLEVKFTAAEFELVEKARQLSGHPTRPAFYHDAIISLAERIVKGEQGTKSSAPAVNHGAHPANIAGSPRDFSASSAQDKAAVVATGTGPVITTEIRSGSSSRRKRPKS